MKTEVRVFESLRDGQSEWNAWMPRFTFPPEGITESLEERVGLVSTICEGTRPGEGEELWKAAIRTGFSCASSQSNKVAVLIENRRKPRSRLRTYKGVVSKTLIQDQKSFQVEYDAGEGKTILGVIVDLSGIGQDEFEQIVFGAPNTFLLMSSAKQVPDAGDLKSVFETAVKWNDEIVFLDYTNLLDAFVSADRKVMRFGGDGGDREVSVQVFTEKAGLEKIASQTRTLLQEQSERSTVESGSVKNSLL